MYADYKNVKEVLDWLQFLEREAEHHRDLIALFHAYYVRGLLSAGMGDLRGAVSRSREKLELSGRIGYPEEGGIRLADYFLLLGDLPKAERHASLALKTGETIGDKGGEAWALRIIGTIHLCRGESKQAVEVLKKAVQINPEAGMHYVEAQRNCALGRALLTQGKRQEAIKVFQNTLALSKPNSPTLYQTGPWMNVDALSGIEASYDDDEVFREFCCRFRQGHPEIVRPMFTQWNLEPAEIPQATAQCSSYFPESLIHDEFTDPRLCDWACNDLYGDCSFIVQDGLEVRAANGRDLWYLNLSAPRILRAASGDFAIQTVCVPVSEEKPAIGGILLWKDDKNFLRLDRGTRGRYEVSFTGCIDNRDVIIGRGRLSSERAFLRLERIGNRVNALCSADGAEWLTVGYVDFPIEGPVEVGLHAIGAIERTIYHGAYPDGTAIRFASFQLWTKASDSR